MSCLIVLFLLVSYFVSFLNYAKIMNIHIYMRHMIFIVSLDFVLGSYIVSMYVVLII